MIDHNSADHIAYTRKQLSTHLVLLEEHFLKFPCHECMTKHLQAVQGYAGEGLVKTGDEIFSRAEKWAERTLKMLNEGTNDQELRELASAARDLRRLVQDNSDLPKEEIEAILLQHDDSPPIVVNHGS